MKQKADFSEAFAASAKEKESAVSVGAAEDRE